MLAHLILAVWFALDRALLHVSLPPGVASGTYRVIWRVTSVDTHVTNGDFRFQIVP